MSSRTLSVICYTSWRSLAANMPSCTRVPPRPFPCTVYVGLGFPAENKSKHQTIAEGNIILGIWSPHRHDSRWPIAVVPSAALMREIQTDPKHSSSRLVPTTTTPSASVGTRTTHSYAPEAALPAHWRGRIATGQRARLIPSARGRDPECLP